MEPAAKRIRRYALLAVMTKPRKHNPAWPDSREARAMRQRRRAERLNELAQAVGYETWRKLETAALNGDVVIAKAEPPVDRQGE